MSNKKRGPLQEALGIGDSSSVNNLSSISPSPLQEYLRNISYVDQLENLGNQDFVKAVTIRYSSTEEAFKLQRLIDIYGIKSATKVVHEVINSHEALMSFADSKGKRVIQLEKELDEIKSGIRAFKRIYEDL